MMSNRTMMARQEEETKSRVEGRSVLMFIQRGSKRKSGN